MGYTKEWKLYHAFWKEAQEIGLNTNHTSSFYNAYKKNPTTFHLPYTHPYNKTDEAPPDMAPASFTSGMFPIASTSTSTKTNSSANNDVFYMKYSVALAGLNNLEIYKSRNYRACQCLLHYALI